MNLASVVMGVWYEEKEQEETIVFFYPLFNEVRKTSGKAGLVDTGNLFWSRSV